MPRYTVNATMSMAAWIELDADTPEEAFDIAQSFTPGAFDYDTGTAEIEFNIDPSVEVA